MNELLQQFIGESRDFLQSISEQLLQLEQSPADRQLVVELFRLVHTLKGNSGLFEFSAVSKVLHAAEDLMDAVRDDRLAFSPALADQLLEAMDFVAHLIDLVASSAYQDADFIAVAAVQAMQLRQLLVEAQADAQPESDEQALQAKLMALNTDLAARWLPCFPVKWQEQARSKAGCYLVVYQPEAECFFKGEDPFYLIQQLPGLTAGLALPAAERVNTLYDCYQSQLVYLALCDADEAVIAQHFRCVPEQVQWGTTVTAVGPTISAEPVIKPALASSLDPAVRDILQTQWQILQLQLEQGSNRGLLSAAYNTLQALLAQLPAAPALPALTAETDVAALLLWTAQQLDNPTLDCAISDIASNGPEPQAAPGVLTALPVAQAADEGSNDCKFGRRVEDALQSKVLKVEQSKIDRLMDLIGEIVVAKNGLPYLAGKAETHYGNRELAREIKTQYGVINRIVEEMQDAIMQVRMMPVSFVFQRFPRLVRDIARKLGKEVNLQIHGEQTEADKNIIEALADPLIHILRNSLDHGLETPAQRTAVGKNPTGILKIRASQESDRVFIQIEDDGRGIDPTMIKRKAWEKQLISEEQLEKISDQEAIQLIFAAGFSTAPQVTDLSGRGVGMDVVKTAVQRVGGTVQLQSDVGKGTRLSLSLPLSMAVTNVMVIGSDQQIFGIPMDLIVETVRLPATAVQYIKQQMSTVLRGRLIPLRSLNQILGLDKAQLQNEEQEFALLVVRTQGEVQGLLVDDFYEVIDIILKPLPGELGKMPLYAGSALLGDGSVLLILNPQELH
ncbi:chemotaxis protein CheA [Aeromonas veronii]|uniref:chemotaxis protein CheA n=1 Tax=Aeromonas TaxID=642 RepID=UPI0013210BE0|nr:chemotaxis protein CheA [Aeromonas veronii]MXV30947.1 chemotaxis protein CheA [Aeromonas veronii]